MISSTGWREGLPTPLATISIGGCFTSTYRIPVGAMRPLLDFVLNYMFYIKCQITSDILVVISDNVSYQKCYLLLDYTSDGRTR